MPMRVVRHEKAEKGTALIEFLLAMILLIFPLLLGTFVFGMSLVRANQVAEVCRDVGHMYAYGVDFSQTGSQNELVKMANGLNMTVSGGNGVVILSTITYIDDNDCKAGGYTSGRCPNWHDTVFTRRIIIGNASLHASDFGTPDNDLLDARGNIQTADFLSNPSVQANNFYSVIPLVSGQSAYMAEAFVVSPDFNFWGGNSFWSWIKPSGISSRSIF